MNKEFKHYKQADQSQKISGFLKDIMEYTLQGVEIVSETQVTREYCFHLGNGDKWFVDFYFNGNQICVNVSKL